MRVIILADPNQTSIPLPADFNPDDNSVHCFGAAAGGRAATKAGGGGGSYAGAANMPFAPGSAVSFQLGLPGASGASPTDGGDTFINGTDFASASVAAKGGRVDTDGQGGLGGAAADNIGNVKFSGGRGGKKSGNPVSGMTEGGGGGAAGPDGDGGDANGRIGGRANGGVGAEAGQSGSEWTVDEDGEIAGPGGGATGRLSSGSGGTPAGNFGGGGSASFAASGGLIVIIDEPLV